MFGGLIVGFQVGYQGKVLGIADHPNECQRYLDCGAALVADRPVGAHYVTQIISGRPKSLQLLRLFYFNVTDMAAVFIF